MPMKDRALEDEFKGRKIDASAMAENGWYDQGGKNYHYGFSTKKGLWLKKIDTAFPCECHPVMLFVLLKVDKGSRITAVATAIHHVHNDGSFVEMDMGFFGPDAANARREVSAVLAVEDAAGVAGKRMTGDVKQPPLKRA